MLVLKRKEGQWVEVVHRSGEVLRLRVYDIQPGAPGRVNIAFDDDARNFEIRRPERRHRLAATPPPAGALPVTSGPAATVKASSPPPAPAAPVIEASAATDES